MKSPRFAAPLAAALLLLACAAPLHAGDAPAPQAPAAPAAKVAAPDRVLQPMLWKVTGPGITEPSYLFGTIHLSDPRITAMHPLSRAAFKKSATLHTEIAMDPKTEASMTKAVTRTDGKKLAADIGPELSKQLNTELKHISPILSPVMLQSLKTWAVAVSLPSLEDQLKGGKPLDAQLWEKAETAGKRCLALETMEEHVGGFETLTPTEQVLLLKGSLEAMAKERKGEAKVTMQKLVTLYLQGDAQAIADIENEEAGAEDKAKQTPEEKALEAKIKTILMANRNPVMLRAVLKEFKEHPGETHFFAAGTAHFVGEGNVCDLLRKEGYAVERLKAAAPEKK